MRTSAIEIRGNLPRTKPKVVIFTDALSVPNKLQNPRQKDLHEHWSTLQAAQTNLNQQWIPAHYRIQGNKQVENLACEEGQLDQEHKSKTNERKEDGCERKTLSSLLTGNLVSILDPHGPSTEKKTNPHTLP